MSMSSSAKELLKRAYSLRTEEETHSLYADWADSYDETMIDGLGYLTPRKTASLLAECLPDRKSEILDVGSGTGLAGEHLAVHGFSTIDALDYSNEMLVVAAARVHQEKSVYRNTVLADLNGPLDLASDSYDAMICTGTFTHAHVGASCLEELFRVLKPGGLFACTVQKDVWSDAGFDVAVKELAQQGIMRTKGMTMGEYFESDEEPQGWYIIWERLK